MTLTSEKLLIYLKNNAALDTDTIKPETALFTSNILDSLSLVNLILFVESELGTKIDPDDVRIENFDSIAQILCFAQSRK